MSPPALNPYDLKKLSEHDRAQAWGEGFLAGQADAIARLEQERRAGMIAVLAMRAMAADTAENAVLDEPHRITIRGGTSKQVVEQVVGQCGRLLREKIARDIMALGGGK